MVWNSFLKESSNLKHIGPTCVKTPEISTSGVLKNPFFSFSCNVSEWPLTAFWRAFHVLLQSKTKWKPIICAPPQGGHLTENNCEVCSSAVFPTEESPLFIFFLFFLTFTWALKPFIYCHLIIIPFNVSVAGDWQCLGRCAFQCVSGFKSSNRDLCVYG